MQDYLKNMPVGVKKMLGVALPLLIVVILFLVVGKFGISKVSDLRKQITKAGKDKDVLTQKLKVLETVSDTLSQGSTISAAVMPDANPSLVVISQLKILGSASGVFIGNIKTGGEIKDESGLSRVDVTFDVSGARPQVIAFLKGTANLAPIMVVSKLKIAENGGGSIANVSVSSFWAAFPKTLPSITDNLTDLTPAERTILIDVSKLTQPIFINISAGEGVGKADPFGP